MDPCRKVCLSSIAKTSASSLSVMRLNNGISCRSAMSFIGVNPLVSESMHGLGDKIPENDQNLRGSSALPSMHPWTTSVSPVGSFCKVLSLRGESIYTTVDEACQGLVRVFAI